MRTASRGTDAQAAHWNRLAQRWRDVGPPLRPGVEDAAILREMIERRRPDSRGPVRGLLLGVTPEIATIDWQPPLALLAIDHSPAMIAAAWPGNGAARAALRGDWFHLPVAAESLDVAMGDGCFNAIDFPAGHRRLAGSIARALRPGGLLAVRHFCRPDTSEGAAAVIDDLRAGRIGNFHVLKWRLAMAVQGDDAAAGVRLGDLWDVYQRHVPDAGALAAATGWPLAHLRAIDSYRGSAGVYSFPTLAETLAVFAADFDCLERRHGRYELADRCPHLLLRRR